MCEPSENPELSFLRATSDCKNQAGRMKMNYLEYNTIIFDIKVALLKTKAKTARNYYILKMYEVFNCDKSEKLIKKRKHEDSPILYLVPL